MVKQRSHDGLCCACCHTDVDLRVPQARGGHHLRTHVDTTTGAEVRLVWCAECVKDDPLLEALVDNDNAPDGDPAAAEAMWALHEQIHARVLEREGNMHRDGAYGWKQEDVDFVLASAVREVFHVKRDCRLRTHTFRGPGRAWGVRAKVKS